MACHVYSDPSVTSFRWYLNNSSETIEITSNTAIFNQTQLRPTHLSLSSSINRTNLNNFYRLQHFYSQPMSFTSTNNLSSSSNLDLYDSPSSNYQTDKVHEDDSQLYISIGRFSPSSRFDFGTVYCKAENQVGLQQEPCKFQLIPAGPPIRLENCHASNHSLTSLVVYCSNEHQQSINLDKYSSLLNNHQMNSPLNNLFNQQLNTQKHIAHHIHSSNHLYLSQQQQQTNEITRRNLFMAIVYEVQNEQLVLNLTRKQPYFVLNTLKPATQYTVLLYAINEQGRSPVNRLHTSTLGPPEKRQMSQSINDETPPDFSLIFSRQSWIAVLFGSFAVILLVISFLVRCAIRTRKLNSNSSNFNESKPDVIQHSSLKLSTIKGMVLFHKKFITQLIFLDHNLIYWFELQTLKTN